MLKIWHKNNRTIVHKMEIYQNKTQSIKIFVDMLNQNLLIFVR